MREHCHHARFVYNIGLEQRRMWTPAKRHHTERVNLVTQMRQLSELRRDLEWLRTGSSVVQQAALRDLDRAFVAFFAGRAKYPQFKRRSDTEGAFAVRDVSVHRLNRHWATVLVPKVGHVRFRLTREWRDVRKATSARVSLKAGRWHIALTTEPPPKIVAGTGAVVGIDRGAVQSIATSDGAFSRSPGLSDGERERLLALERCKARQTKGSNRRKRTVTQIATLHARLRRRRSNWLEVTTTDLARTYDVVVLERLNTRAMTRRPAPKPDPELAGSYLPNGARAKAGLNRVILASLWGEFELRLRAKMPAGAVVTVPAPFTSQRCSECGYTDARNRESQADFRCLECGHLAHADTNAAHNIVARYTAQLSPVDDGSVDATVLRHTRVNPTVFA